MDVFGEQRVLLGLDVIASASNPGADLHRLSQAWQEILRDSLSSAGLGRSDVVEWDDQGDGALLTLPYASLGTVVDMSQRLHEHTAAYNRRCRPEVRLRMAVEVGPVPTTPTYLRAKIDRARLLDAKEFKDLLTRCHAESDDGVHTGLIVSDYAFRTVFGGDYTALVHRSEFAELSVSAKEFHAMAWVRVPGYDMRSLRALSSAAPPVLGDVAHRPDAGVHNEVNGTMRGVQAGVVHGGITFGGGR